MRPELPELARIEPKRYTPVVKAPLLDIDIEKIYEQDLFDTFRPEPEEPIKPAYDRPFPEIPKPAPVIIPEPPKPQFLDPLNITLRGIIVVGFDPSKNAAIITDNQTGRETVYKVGDPFEDAVLIRILNNKVIFLRANGQQEVLYVRAQDAKEDPSIQLLSEWDEVIMQIGQNTYKLDPKKFTQRIANLSQLIDILELTSTYKEGKSFGVRIGQLSEQSLGTHLGLQQGDIILHINEIPADSYANRIQIYEQITAMTYGDIITIDLVRDNEQKTITITLADFMPPPSAPGEKETITSLQKIDNSEKINILKEKHRFAPTIQEIRKRERQHMLEQGASRDH